MLKMSKKKSRTVNMWIARSYQTAGQIIGMQLSIANVLALAVSAASVVAGATLLAVQQFPTAWPLWLAASGIGTGLAFLIEGLTLSALIRIRVAGREVRQIDARLERECHAYLKTLLLPDPLNADYPLQKKRYRALRKMVERDYRHTRRLQTRRARRDRRNSLLQAGGGCLASMCAGGLFYHAILSSLGQIASLSLTAVFTLAVTGTFISGEVFKDLQEQAIREAFTNGNLAESAMRQETRVQSLWAVYRQMSHFIQSPEAQQVIAEGGKLLVTGILEDLHRDLRQSLIPEEQAPASLIPSEPQTTHGLSAAGNGQGGAGYAFAERAIQGQATQDRATSDDPSRATFPLASESPDSEPEIRATAEAFPQAASVFQEHLKNKEEGEKHLDTIGRAMLSLLDQIAPEEQKALLKLAQISPAEMLQELQKRYPGYASFFTEERIAGIIQAISQRGSPRETSERQREGYGGHYCGSARQEKPGYDSQQHAPGNNPGTEQERNAVQSLTANSRQKHEREPTNSGKLEKGPKPRLSTRRRSVHRERIKAVMLQAQKSDQPLTYRKIANAADVGYSTVKKYAQAIRKEIQDTGQ